MEREWNNKGQFYLIAAIIIVGIIVGFVSITNYVKEEKNIVVEDLKKELKVESRHVLDYESISGTNKIREFGEDYSYYIGSSVDVYFITGENPTKAYKYTNGVETDVSDNLDTQDDKIIFTLEGTDYEFNLNSGRIFYFLILQKSRGDTYVTTS